MAFIVGENEQKIEIENVKVDYSAKGNLYVLITFKDEDDDRINWVGSFTDKAAARTIEQLKFLGYKASSLTGLGQNWRNSFENLHPNVSLAVESVVSNSGQTYLKCNWINKKIDRSKLVPDLTKFDNLLGKKPIDQALDKVDKMFGGNNDSNKIFDNQGNTNQNNFTNSNSNSNIDFDIPF